MKLIGKENLDGKPVLVTETKRFLLKPKIRKFVAQSIMVKGFWEWLELPNKNIVGDYLAFQLDAWMRDSISK